MCSDRLVTFSMLELNRETEGRAAIKGNPLRLHFLQSLFSPPAKNPIWDNWCTRSRSSQDQGIISRRSHDGFNIIIIFSTPSFLPKTIIRTTAIVFHRRGANMLPVSITRFSPKENKADATSPPPSLVSGSSVMTWGFVWQWVRLTTPLSRLRTKLSLMYGRHTEHHSLSNDTQELD